ncbi:MAG: RCC1 domain-containing protein [Bdellovibrionales bacterium]
MRWLYVCGWLALIVSVGCTRDASQDSTLILRFDQESGRSQKTFAASIEPTSVAHGLSLSTKPSWSTIIPSTLADINCYMVFLGADTPGLQESSCTNENNEKIMSFGVMAGLFSRESSAALSVRSGPQRRIYIVGLKMVSGSSCETMTGTELTFSNYSNPYLLATKTVDLAPGDVTVDLTMSAQFTSSTKLNECTFLKGGPAVVGIKLASAYSHVCALSPSGAVKCWGLNTYGQLGLGHVSNIGDGVGEMGTNLSTVSLGGLAKQIAVGAQHSCALLNNGSVKCWGNAADGQLGYGDTNNRGDDAGEMGVSLPTVDLGTGRTAVELVAGNYFNCALLDNATVKCWGTNTDGMLGLGDLVNRGGEPTSMGDNLPALSFAGGLTPVHIAAGVNNACAIMSDGSLQCWGAGANGAIGDGSSSNRSVPTPVSGLGAGSGVVKVEIGYQSVCALLNTGGIKCWGDAQSGEAGDGTSGGGNYKLTPVVVSGIHNAIDLSLGNDHACAILADGLVRCWGANTNGGLGVDDSVIRTTPTQVLNISGATHLATGQYNTCAVLAGARVKCWGASLYGELGLEMTGVLGNSAGSMSALPDVNLGSF